jgi:hypothetical protein
MAVSWKVYSLCVMWDKVAAEDEWWSAIHGCKEYGNNMRLDKDKRGDAKEEEGGCQAEERAISGW